MCEINSGDALSLSFPTLKRYDLFTFNSFCLSLALLLGIVAAQAQNAADAKIHIHKISEEIRLDGVLDEAAWAQALPAKDFFQNYPSDTLLARYQTEVKVLFDDQAIYIAAICYSAEEGNFVVNTLKRDFTIERSDAFAVYLDPFQDKTNGFSFAVSPYGVQYEGLIEGGGGGFGQSSSWDNVWEVEVKQQGTQWTAEMAIPFKSLRYKDGAKSWRIQFARQDLRINERSSWIPVPRNFDVSSLAFTGLLIWDDPPPKTGANITFIPYAIASGQQDFEEDTEQGTLNTGLDAKIAVSTSLNLDVTINPDFSQVEVDEQQTNLTRFSLFFPEKRTFFIENSDLFGQFGFRQIRPFFSRRIGLNENGEAVSILGGARLTGKLNEKWRIGLMSTQTDGQPEENSQNFTVAAFQRQVFGRSNIAGIFVNKQGFDGGSIENSEYNRILGLDYNIHSSDNKWRGKVFFHNSFNTSSNSDNYAYASWLMFRNRNFFWMWNHEYVGKNYLAEVGFVPRTNVYDALNDTVVRQSYHRFEPQFNWIFYPKTAKLINSHQVGIYLSDYYNIDLEPTERLTRLSYQTVWQNSGRIELGIRDYRTVLQFASDVTGNMDTILPKGTYQYDDAYLTFVTSTVAPLHLHGDLSYGEFYNGNKFSYGGALHFRLTPIAWFGLSLNQNEILFPEPYGRVDLTLLSTRIEITFTKNLYLTTFVQYNTQFENFNIYSRMQWQFRPLSNLYLAYTDNYLPTGSLTDRFGLSPKNKALVLKFVYWLNI